MRKFDKERNTRLDMIETILRASAHYTCGNVNYRRGNTFIHIYGTKEGSTLYSVEVASLFLAFAMFAEYNAEAKKVELVVF
jgi:hypothetical protein